MAINNSVVSASPKRTVASFFAGVGGIDLGFENTGEFNVVYANEFDKNARVTYKHNFDNDLDGRDIRFVETADVPKTDLIVGGFPCTSFSIAGYRKGFEDEHSGDLFFEMLRIINSKKPESIFIENVKNMVGHDHGNTFKVIREALVLNGYYIKWKVLNAKDYGNIPQNRERIYIVGFRNKNAYEIFQFPEEIDLITGISDTIDFENEVDDRYYYIEGKQPFYDKLKEAVNSQQSIYQWRRQYVRENKSGVVPTLTANMGTGGHNVPIILSNTGIRKLTPRETFNVQGFPKTFNLPEISTGQLYKQAGNSVVVPVIQRIAFKISEALDKNRVTLGNAPAVLNNKYAIIYVDMRNKFEGSSYVEAYSSTYEKAFEEIENLNLPLLKDDEYLKFVQKNKNLEFYSIVAD